MPIIPSSWSSLLRGAWHVSFQSSLGAENLQLLYFYKVLSTQHAVWSSPVLLTTVMHAFPLGVNQASEMPSDGCRVCCASVDSAQRSVRTSAKILPPMPSPALPLSVPSASSLRSGSQVQGLRARTLANPRSAVPSWVALGKSPHLSVPVSSLEGGDNS